MSVEGMPWKVKERKEAKKAALEAIRKEYDGILTTLVEAQDAIHTARNQYTIFDEERKRLETVDGRISIPGKGEFSYAQGLNPGTRVRREIPLYTYTEASHVEQLGALREKILTLIEGHRTGFVSDEAASLKTCQRDFNDSLPLIKEAINNIVEMKHRITKAASVLEPKK